MLGLHISKHFYPEPKSLEPEDIMQILPLGFENLASAIDRTGRAEFGDLWSGIEGLTRDGLVAQLGGLIGGRDRPRKFAAVLAETAIKLDGNQVTEEDEPIAAGRWKEARGILHQRLAHQDEAAIAFSSAGVTTPIEANEWLSIYAGESLVTGIWPPHSNYGQLDSVLIATPPLSPEVASSVTTLLPHKTRQATGRPGKWDWEGAMIRLACINAIEGTENKKTSELVSLVQDWFVAETKDSPVTSDIKLRVDRFCAGLSAAAKADGNS